MFLKARRAKYAFICLGFLVLLLQLSISYAQEVETGGQILGTGVGDEKDVMDTCEGAAGPRPINGVYSPGRTNVATIDDVNGGFCGVSIDRPGIWWWVEGTGDIITVSSCHKQTEIKVKMSVFTGSCDDLQCVTGTDQPDYECPVCKVPNPLEEWKTFATSLSFPSELGQNYYILVQQEAEFERGTVWLNFQTPIIPQNDNCVDAIGPVPRDLTKVEATNIFGSISVVDDYCGGENVPPLYPGSWFQVMGTGKKVTVMACSDFNFDGYAFSVYNGANCDSLECVQGRYQVNVVDEAKCVFDGLKRPLTKFTFDTVDRDRYYVYVHYARTRVDKPTSDFRFFVDDGSEGKGGSSGAHVILIDETGTVGIGGYDHSGGIWDKSGDKKSSSTTARLSGCISVLILILSMHFWS
eukprot:CAMPEP_0172377398 /NCGR_PEP_ID=MMETSP1060-20121228/68883_1 /TAXON_ID=37318 /ORGANISM="Pseudo-nitzschia pungens, Strain cf. cingulata" /LENGTH=409 /DNA_ID=CAMNT_0013105083 /DNA_START=91 /DNA_END=1320 /DNA_ORIENTATION=+